MLRYSRWNLTKLSFVTVSLPERLSPDGGEDVQLKTLPLDVVHTVRGDDELNRDVAQEKNSNERSLSESKTSSSSAEGVSTVEMIKMKHAKLERFSEGILRSSLKQDEDLTALDVKCSRLKHNPQIDNIELIFKDMEPVISRTAIVEIPHAKANFQNKFTAAESEGDYFDGWGNEIDNEWISSDTEA